MKRNNFGHVVFGFGLGLICAAIIFAVYFYRNDILGNSNDANNMTSGWVYMSSSFEHGKPAEDNMYVAGDDVPPTRIIRLDGDVPLENSKKNDEEATTLKSRTLATFPSTVKGETTTEMNEPNSTTEITLTSTTTAMTTYEPVVTPSSSAETETLTSARSTTHSILSSSTSPNVTDEIVSMTITRGDTARGVANRLLDLRLIEDTEAFLDRLSVLGLTGELLDGSYSIQKGLPLDELILSITVKK